MRRLEREYGMEGYKEANMIIGKLLKTQNDGRPMLKPSSFVSKCVNNAESYLQDGVRPDIGIVTV